MKRSRFSEEQILLMNEDKLGSRSKGKPFSLCDAKPVALRSDLSNHMIMS